MAGIPPTLILLPGLDGTGDLFRPLLGVIPRGITAQVISYPPDRALSYDALLALIERELPTDRPVVLVAESFSGPLALRCAAMHPQRVRAVAMCASCIRSPLPHWLRWLVTPLLFRLPPPAFLLRLLLVGRDSPKSLVQSVRRSIRNVHPNVLAARLRDVFDVDCSEALRQCEAPILYLRAARDALLRPSTLRAIQAVRRVETRALNAPHLLLQAEPIAGWREIQAFLVRHEIRVAP